MNGEKMKFAIIYMEAERKRNFFLLKFKVTLIDNDVKMSKHR